MPNEIIIYVGTVLLAVIGVFLMRLLRQIDQLITIVAEVKTALIEHKGDVLVIKEQVSNHTKELDDINLLWDRVRIVENDITGIKASRN